MSLAFPSPEFDLAVAAVCHRSATDEQLRALNKLLRSHPAARDEYILRLELHSRLASDPDLFASEAEEPVPSPRNVLPLQPARRFPQSSWLLALAACGALLLTGAWWVYRSEPGARQGDTSKAVAMLNRVADAVWQQPGENPRLGAPLEPGWLRLKSGLVQIVFYSGARLVIEGPAELQLVSPGEVVCLGGRLIAEVPPPAKGFRVRTPRMTVTDLGTVFGVDVSALETELHVFKGSVEFQSPASAAKQNMLEGRGAIADGAAPARLVSASRSRFASLFELQNKSSEAEVLRHEQWRAASSRLDEDPTLLVHFDFEPVDLSDWRLPNSSKLKGATPDATIVGCQWTEGRWPDKRALEFRNVSDRVRLEVASEYNALTLAAWVRVQGMDRQINSLFMSDGFDAGTVHWSIRDDGVLGLTAIGAEPGRYQICASPPALRLDQFGLWIHLAAVIDGDSKRVVHYLNGLPVSEHALKIAPPFRIGVAELGNWNARGFPKNDPFMIRNFSGAMDDFCLFSRALSSEEIRGLYSVGKPQPESARHRN
jgi:Concanavalin A-like lectin/glucanases superfamily/FecR protein